MYGVCRGLGLPGDSVASDVTVGRGPEALSRSVTVSRRKTNGEAVRVRTKVEGLRDIENGGYTNGVIAVGYIDRKYSEVDDEVRSVAEARERARDLISRGEHGVFIEVNISVAKDEVPPGTFDPDSGPEDDVYRLYYRGRREVWVPLTAGTSTSRSRS